ncbi:RagB/SusD family nutrient uptake outer membrane protein [Pinibacter aurantiacus]|uniref:RagB/SusD family nutrient uptake outer membrane protein n=1 Tax=Pinibacter aurantiacus TaxID=2851599 RepID=A0A9E2W2G4_9BACT|nr:RagB/SusD family nutrient uptake outer membrane protein [Pinibacter aurantiacus]MBV4357300.1 RagB/SusD family nutrient uptake outer membrane protein [Pinibacter aurantiacus]
MIKNISVVIIAIGMMFIASCSKYTDITPKGKNLLNRIVDLDLLLNYDYAGNKFNFMNESILINDMYPQAVNVPNIINGTARDLNYLYVTYDTTVDRISLTTTDPVYQGLYSVIANVSNIVIANVDNASGDKIKGKQLKAEAYILRAYMHYLLVNIFAKAYDPASASKDGGIPYVTDFDLGKVNAKVSVEEVYKNLLADIDAGLTLNSLPDKPQNSMRIGNGFAYAVKARILLSMRNYTDALTAVEKALTYNNVLEDHRPFLSTKSGGQGLPVSRDGLNAPDNLLYAYYGKSFPTTFSPSLEILSNYYEPGNIIKDSTPTYNYLYGQILSGIPGVPMFLSVGAYQQNSAGMTVSDLYLMKAECLIRLGNFSEGMDAVNEVRKRRIYPFTPKSANNEADAMNYLQKTDRIEFLYTWRNFVDLKRWNAEGKYKVTVTRTVSGKTYTLSPGSSLWIFPFPKNATDYNPSLKQNF